MEFGAKYREMWKEVSFDLKEKRTKKINEAPLDGVHPDKKDWIESGDEIINKIMPELSPEEQTYLKTIASDSYEETVNRVEEYTGIRVEPGNFPSLFSLLFQTLRRTKDIEATNTRYLEELALSLVFSVPEFKIVEEAYLNDELRFDVKLASAELDRLTQVEELEEEPEEEEEGLSQSEELNLELADAWEGISEESLKRKFSNMLISGGSINKLYLFNMAIEKLERIDADLPKYYGILSSMAQIGYWLTPFNIEQQAAGGEDTAAGSEEVVPEGEKYVIKVRGITFPFLVHELVKGIYEYLALDPDQQVAMQDDKLEDETKDMMAGPGVYKAVTSYLPADKQEILPIVQKKLTGLSVEDIRNVIAKNSAGQAIMRDLIADADKEWSNYQQDKEDYRSFESTGISEGLSAAKKQYVYSPPRKSKAKKVPAKKGDLEDVSPEDVDTKKKDAKKAPARVRHVVPPGKMSPQEFRMLAAKDPTPQKKYIEWMCAKYVERLGTMRQFDEMAEFDQLCNSNKIDQKDHKQYASMEAIGDAIAHAHLRISQNVEADKEKKVRKALNKFGGAVGLTRKALKTSGITKEYIDMVKRKMGREEKGIFGMDEPVPIDTDIFNHIDPDDFVFENDYIMIVNPKTKEKMQLYGRNHLHDPENPSDAQRYCYWCVGYKNQGTNLWSNYYGNQGACFYVVLPKDSDYVTDIVYYKVAIEAQPYYKGGRRNVWGFHDVMLNSDEAKKLFDFWDIEWDGDTENREKDKEALEEA